MKSQQNRIQIGLFVWLFFIVATLAAQKDTLYFNEYWQTTVKDNADFYRIPLKKIGNLYEFQDYYMSGQLQMKGLSKSATKEVWEGVVVWYDEDGGVRQKGMYKGGRLDGEFLSYREGEKLVAQFKNNRLIKGEQLVKNGSYNYYRKKRGDSVFAIVYDKDVTGIRYETAGNGIDNKVRIKYFGKNGVFIGERTKNTDGKIVGLDVSYYYKPMRVKEIKYYKGGNYLTSTMYYGNGQLRELYEKKPTHTKTYYAEDGTVIGRVKFGMNQGYLKAEEGKIIYFKRSKGQEGKLFIATVYEYEGGKKVDEEYRYENQQVERKVLYEAGEKKEQRSYNETGEEIARITYKNYLPHTGAELFDDRKVTYKEGTLVEEIAYYPKSKIRFSVKNLEKEMYYTKEGVLLGELAVKNNDGYPKPMNGAQYTIGYDGDINLIREYKHGSVIKSTSFSKRGNDTKTSKTFKRIEEFQEGSYSKIRERSFYSNGSRQSVMTYVGYNKKTGIFYDAQDQEMGRYDFLKQDGTHYEFFDTSDAVRLMEVRVMGKLKKQKRYNYGPGGTSGDIRPILEVDVDIDCCGTYYDREGKLFASLEFKEGQPWNGTAYDHNTREFYTVSEGKREGAYRQYDYNGKILKEGNYKDDKEEGLFSFYTYNGDLSKTEVYQNGELNGTSHYYDIDGALTSQLVYKEGNPIEGTRVVQAAYNQKGSRETFKDGQIVTRISYDKNGKRKTRFLEDKAEETTAYYDDTDKKRLQFSIKDNYLEGTVTRYDVNGEAEYIAVVEKGRLIKGAILLIGKDVRGGAEYIWVEKQPDLLKVRFIGETGKVLFKAEENLAFEEFSVFLRQLHVDVEYLNEYLLY